MWVKYILSWLVAEKSSIIITQLFYINENSVLLEVVQMFNSVWDCNRFKKQSSSSKNQKQYSAILCILKLQLVLKTIKVVAVLAYMLEQHISTGKKNAIESFFNIQHFLQNLPSNISHLFLFFKHLYTVNTLSLSLYWSIHELLGVMSLTRISQSLYIDTQEMVK